MIIKLNKQYLGEDIQRYIAFYKITYTYLYLKNIIIECLLLNLLFILLYNYIKAISFTFYLYLNILYYNFYY